MPKNDNTEKTTQEKIEDLTKWILDQFVSIKHFVKNGKSIGLYRWNGRKFIECEEELKNIIENNDLEYKINTHIVNEVIEKIKRKTYHELIENNDLIISFDNGIFDWTDLLTDNITIKSFEEYTKELREGITNIIPFIHIPHELDITLLKTLFEHKDVDIENEKRIIEQLEPDITNIFKQWTNDNWLILYEIIGYILYPKYAYHKAIMLKGIGSNGKSTYIRLLIDVVGKDNAISLPLHEICEERFVRSQLINKLLNAYPDLPYQPLKYTGYFKALTGEDRITADIKYREPISFTNFAKFVFSANQLPKTLDKTDAFFERWIIIDFPNKFQRIDGFYETHFTEEKIKRIIAIGIWTFYLVLKRNEFSITEEMREAKEIWIRESEPIYDFIQTMIERGILIKDIDGKILDSDLWKLWLSFAEEQGYETMDKRRFTMELENYGITKIRHRYESYYKGLRLTQNDLKNENKTLIGVE
jgi:putative DNA primase/helicase